MRIFLIILIMVLLTTGCDLVVIYVPPESVRVSQQPKVEGTDVTINIPDRPAVTINTGENAFDVYEEKNVDKKLLPPK